MGTTTNRGYPYPNLANPADVPYYMQQLADAIDTDLGTDDGWEDLSSYLYSGVTGTFQGRILNNVVYLRGDLTIAIPTSSQVQLFAGLPTKFRPALFSHPLTTTGVVITASGFPANGFAGTAGDGYARNAHTAALTGVRITATFPKV